MGVVFGDREARLALEEPELDYDVASAGLVAGRNHPDDIAGMIALFRYFRHAPFMARAIDFWAEGDALILELDQVATAIHDGVRAQPAAGAPRRAARAHALDRRRGHADRGRLLRDDGCSLAADGTRRSPP